MRKKKSKTNFKGKGKGALKRMIIIWKWKR